jgi:hypothetical protein
MPDSKGNITIVPLEFSFKGDRNYIHGTSVYEKVSDYIFSTFPDRVNGTFQVVIHAFAKKRCNFVYAIDDGHIAKPESGRIEIITSTGIHGWLVETEDEVSDRDPFPESEIVERCQIGDNRSVFMSAKVFYHPIEVLVSITKHLHLNEFPNTKGKWVFSRLELNRLLKNEDVEKMSVKIQHSIGTRLTNSDVSSGAETIGKIYFSMVSEWPE